MAEQLVHLGVEIAHLDLGLEIRAIVLLRAQPVARLLAFLAHHDHRRLQRGDTRQHQIEQDEREVVERPPEQLDRTEASRSAIRSPKVIRCSNSRLMF
jgi:hypothetical protein